MDELGGLILSLGLTIGLEYLVYLLWFRSRPVVLLGVAGLINATTQPVATFAYQRLALNLWLIELGVWLVETLLLKLLLQLPCRKALLLSLLANGVTTLAGVWLFGVA